jgi:hypothetical protein
MRCDPKASCQRLSTHNLAGLLLVAWLLGACAAPPAQNQTPLPGATSAAPTRVLSPLLPSATPAPTTTAATEETMPTAPGNSGLSLEESLRINPPPPTELKAVRTAEGIQLSWAPPPPVTVPHDYSDKVAYYKVYRRTDGSQFAFLAQTPQLLYLDRSAQAGIRYDYTVTAMLDDTNESLQPDEVTVP